MASTNGNMDPQSDAEPLDATLNPPAKRKRSTAEVELNDDVKQDPQDVQAQIKDFIDVLKRYVEPLRLRAMRDDALALGQTDSPRSRYVQSHANSFIVTIQHPQYLLDQLRITNNPQNRKRKERNQLRTRLF